METSNRMARFVRMAAALMVMASLAACANKEMQPDSALTGEGSGDAGLATRLRPERR